MSIIAGPLPYHLNKLASFFYWFCFVVAAILFGLIKKKKKIKRTEREGDKHLPEKEGEDGVG